MAQSAVSSMALLGTPPILAGLKTTILILGVLSDEGCRGSRLYSTELLPTKMQDPELAVNPDYSDYSFLLPIPSHFRMTRSSGRDGGFVTVWVRSRGALIISIRPIMTAYKVNRRRS